MGLEDPARRGPDGPEGGLVGCHFMLTKVRGRFTDVDATVEIGERPADSRTEAVIATASIATGDATRDDRLRSPDLFDVDTWPTATFRSTAVDWDGDTGNVTGELAIAGITRPVTLEVTFLGAVVGPWGNDRAVSRPTAASTAATGG